MAFQGHLHGFPSQGASRADQTGALRAQNQTGALRAQSQTGALRAQNPNLTPVSFTGQFLHVGRLLGRAKVQGGHFGHFGVLFGGWGRGAVGALQPSKVHGGGLGRPDRGSGKKC